MVTLVLAAPLLGVKDVKERVPPKSAALVAAVPFTVTVILPAVFPLGTVAVMLVGEEEVTVAAIPFSFTMLLAFMVLKPVPVIVRELPSAPIPGVNEVMANGNTRNSVALVTVTPSRVILIFPVVAVTGTITVRLVGVLAVIVAVTPLNFTV
jgi:hypothetical protein